LKFYIGTYTSLGGPGACVIEAENASLKLVSSTRAIDNPGYLIQSRDKKTVYASASFGADAKGAAASYRVSGDTLIPLSLQPTGGMSACHVCLSEYEDFLYITNYVTGTISVFPVSDGYIMPRVQLVKHTGASRAYKDRQDSAHTHQAVFMPGSNRLFVCDLGMDEVSVYIQDEETGLLMKEAAIPSAPGSGPRHLVFDGENRFYLGCELSNEIKTYINENGQWKCVQTLSTLPESFAGESAVSAVRKYKNLVFISNRGYDSAARFTIGKDGLLSEKQIIPIQGSFPRDIWPLGKNSLLAANQFGNTVEWIENGKTIASVEIPGAICILPV